MKLRLDQLEPGKRYRAFHPSGKEIDGSMDLVPGRAIIRYFYVEADKVLLAEYAGETEMFWDGQRTEEDENGEAFYETHDAEYCRESELLFEEITD